MRKHAELTNPDSCMSHARDNEMTFVLLGRDIAAPATIRFWIHERIRLGKNEETDPQLMEAFTCAAQMEIDRDQSTAPEPSVAAEAGLPSQMLRDFLSLASEWRRNCEKAGNDAAHVPQRMCAVDVECLVKSYQRRLPAHPGIVPGWVQMPVAMAAAEYAWQHDDWDWSAVEEGLRSRLEDRDWCLSCELAAAPKGQPAGFTEEDEG